jgi:hypothetical protein
LSFSVTISRRIEAPLSFAYTWCTDFREDDTAISGQKRRITIHEKTRNRFIMSVRSESRGRIVTAARIVSLKPPNAWHLDWIGDEHDESGDYNLRRLSGGATRLTMTFKVRNKAATASTKAAFATEVNSMWDKYVAALESDYRRSTAELESSNQQSQS